MFVHRFLGEGAIESYPRPVGPTFSGEGFVVCPMPLQSAFGQADPRVAEVYLLAYERAKACVASPWHERSFTASWN